jgi:hypothetical protein
MQGNRCIVECYEPFLRSALIEAPEAVGNYVIGPAYTLLNPPGLNLSYRVAGKSIRVAIELAHPLSNRFVRINSADLEPVATSGGGVKVNWRHLFHLLDLDVLARQVGFMEKLILRA